MAHSSNAHRARNTIGAIVLIVFVAVGLLVASINYRAGAAVLGGALAAFVIVLTMRAIARSRRRILLIVLMIPVVLLGLVVLFGVFLMSRSRQSASPIILCPVAEHYIVIDPDTPRLQGFQIHEAVTLVEGVEFSPPAEWQAALVHNQPGYNLPDRSAAVAKRGFLLREAAVSNALACSENTFIELNDIPLNTFYAAVYAYDEQHFPYVDTETITWTPGSSDVRFSYIAPPFQVLRPLLSPVMGASSASQWVVGLASIAGTLIFYPIIQPIMVEMIQKVVKKKLGMTEEGQ